MPQKIDKIDLFSLDNRNSSLSVRILSGLQKMIESVIHIFTPKFSGSKRVIFNDPERLHKTGKNLENYSDSEYALNMWKDRFQRRRRKGFRNLKKTNYSGFFYVFSKFVFFGIILSFIAAVAILSYVAYELPSPDKIIRREGFSTKILDRNGEVLYDIYQDQKRIPVKFEDVPEYLKEATISIEDKNFYKHEGFDVLGIIRGFTKVFTRGRAQGGSTLTQQLVKNVLLTSERSVLRKVKEFVLAIQIERKYSKDEILLMYLNEAPYGGTSWGVEAASESYFDKSVADLNLIESAILAGLPQRPSYYSPYSGNPEAYKGRTKDVLRRMREDGYITTEQEDEANKMLDEIKFAGKGGDFKAPHFVQYVQQILEEKYGPAIIEQGGYKITTTLDLKLQEKAQEIVSEEIGKVEKLHITNGAVVVIDSQTGEILAMVGSKDFNAKDYDGQVNVTESLRQPGSAFKPFTYVTAFKKYFTPSTLIMDVPTEFPGGIGQPVYKPLNYDGKYRGPIQLRYALANSINIPAVKLLAMVGIKDVLETAYEMGINSLEPSPETMARVGLSLTLGGGEVRLLELTGAYGAFMNKGYRIDPLSILKIEDSSGKIIEEVKPEKGKKVLTDEEAFLIADILSDNKARSMIFGENSLLNIKDKQVAVKTGTTNDKRDNWAIGGNSQVVVGAWVGNNDNSQMKEVASGVSGASPIWRNILIAALAGKTSPTFEIPPNIVTKEVDMVSGYSAHDGFSSRLEYFIKGTEPGSDPVHLKLKVCKNQEKLATPSDIASGNYDEKEFFLFKEEDATGGIDGVNKWQEGILGWIALQNDPRYNPPTVYCEGSNTINLDFISPHDHDSGLPERFSVEVKVDSIYEVTEVRLEIDGVKYRTFTGKPYREDINFSVGVHQLRVIARDEKGKESDRTINIGVGVPWDYSPSPTPVPTLTPVYTPTP
jgi:1A family penicillin-binding protein